MQALGHCGFCVPRRLFQSRTDFLLTRANMAAIRQAASRLHFLRYFYIFITTYLFNVMSLEERRETAYHKWSLYATQIGKVCIQYDTVIF